MTIQVFRDMTLCRSVIGS